MAIRAVVLDIGGVLEVVDDDVFPAPAERRLGPSASAAQVAALVDELWRLNAARIGTGNPNLIHAGQTLQLP